MPISVNIHPVTLDWPVVPTADSYDCGFAELPGRGSITGAMTSPNPSYDATALLAANTLVDGKTYRFTVKATKVGAFVDQGTVDVTVSGHVLKAAPVPPPWQAEITRLAARCAALEAATTRLENGLSSAAKNPDTDKKIAEAKKLATDLQAEIARVQGLIDPKISTAVAPLQTKLDDALKRIDDLRSDYASLSKQAAKPGFDWSNPIGLVIVFMGLVFFCFMMYYFMTEHSFRLRKAEQIDNLIESKSEAAAQRTRSDMLQNEVNRLQQETIAQRQVFVPPVPQPQVPLGYYVIPMTNAPAPTSPPPASVTPPPSPSGVPVLTNPTPTHTSLRSRPSQRIVVNMTVNNIVRGSSEPLASQDIVAARFPSLRRMAQSMQYQYPTNHVAYVAENSYGDEEYGQ